MNNCRHSKDIQITCKLLLFTSKCQITCNKISKFEIIWQHTRGQSHQVLQTAFSYKNFACNLIVLTFQVCTFLAQEYRILTGANPLIKCWWTWHQKNLATHKCASTTWLRTTELDDDKLNHFHREGKKRGSVEDLPPCWGPAGQNRERMKNLSVVFKKNFLTSYFRVVHKWRHAVFDPPSSRYFNDLRTVVAKFLIPSH